MAQGAFDLASQFYYQQQEKYNNNNRLANKRNKLLYYSFSDIYVEFCSSNSKLRTRKKPSFIANV